MFAIFISMALAEGCDTERLTELVQSKVQGAEAIRHHGKEMAFALPMDRVSQFPGNMKYGLAKAVSNETKNRFMFGS